MISATMSCRDILVSKLVLFFVWVPFKRAPFRLVRSALFLHFDFFDVVGAPPTFTAPLQTKRQGRDFLIVDVFGALYAFLEVVLGFFSQNFYFGLEPNLRIFFGLSLVPGLNFGLLH